MALRTLDDRDPAVEYVGVWQLGGNPQEEYNGTTTMTEIPGSMARVTFTGTGISVFGTVEIFSKPVSNYMIQGNASTGAQFVGNGSSIVEYGVKFYEVKDLELGRHTLTITNEQLTSGRLYLDYFTVVGDITPSIESISSRAHATPISSVSASPSASSVPIPASSRVATASPSSPPIGPIIGGVLGGVALICWVALCIMLYRRQRRRDLHLEHGVEPSPAPGPSPITPFVAERSQYWPASSQGLSYASQTGSGSIASSSQPLTFAPLYHAEKQPYLPTTSPSNMSSLPFGAEKMLDPPPRYEG